MPSPKWRGVTASRWRCWPTSPRPSTPWWPGNCAPRASRCWKAPAPGCWRCATCWHTARGPRGRGLRRRTPPAASAGPGRCGPGRWHRPRRSACSATTGSAGSRRPRAGAAEPAGAAQAAATEIGYPVVLKTAEPDFPHKSDAGGVVLGIRDAAELAAAYAGLSGRLGPRVLVCETAGPGTELSLGILADPGLGPLVVVGAGGVLVEHLADRAVALPPVDRPRARRMLSRLRVAPLLTGFRGRPPANLGAIATAITAVSAIACELGREPAALDNNPPVR